MIRYVLFDFDGTLVDSSGLFISSFNQVAENYKLKKIEAANLEYLKSLSLMDRFRFLQVPLYKLPFLTKKFLSFYESEVASISLHEGMKTVLEEIAALGLGVGIVSSNSAATVKSFLTGNHLSVVSDVYCSGRLFGKDRILKKFLKDKQLTGSEVLYVCDEWRDIEACHKVQIEPVWVSWGFERKEAQGHLHFIAVHSPEELLDLIRKKHILMQS